MELREFVRETLNQVIGGVIEAQEANASFGTTAEISPSIKTQWNILEAQGKAISLSGHIVQNLDFDVALTVSEKTQTKGGIGIVIGVLGLGSQGSSESAGTTASRIKFTVPLVLPHFKNK